MAEAVAILRILLIDEVLTVTFRQDIAIAMVPSYATIELKLISILIVQVHTNHLVSCETLATCTKSATTATTRESHIIGVIGIGHQE